MALRPELSRVLGELLAASEDTRTVTLDEIGDALGILPVGTEEIDRLMAELESRGRRVGEPEAQHGESRLRVVMATARELREQLGRAPRPEEIAARASMPLEHVRHALALARVMQR